VHLDSHLILSETILQPGAEWIYREPGWRLARILEGHGLWLEKGGVDEIQSGQTLIIPPHSAGSFHASRLATVKIQFFRWRPDLMGGILSLSEQRYFTAADQTKSAPARILGQGALAAHFQSLAASPPGGATLLNRLKLLQLIGEVFGQDIARQAAATAARPLTVSERFERLLGGLTEREILDFKPSELARRCGCSLRHFSRLFNQHFGTSVRARQTRLRLHNASLLLLESDHKIIDVAMDSGYRHLGLFNNLFKKHLGMTPSQWRKKNSSHTPRRRAQPAMLFAFLLWFWFWPGAGRAADAAAPAAPAFKVSGYQVEGNSVLSTNIIDKTLAPYQGERVTLDQIRQGLTRLQQAYRDRGFVTVKVTLPQQRLTNGLVRVQVTEGRLAEITVTHNHYFSSNNVMRALPNLRTNMLLNSLVFQQDLDRANASRDRQIYPEVVPGPDPGSSALRLKVVDRLPLHARLDFNNEYTPGTPDMRAGLSLVDDNLWQSDHQFGLQYTLSPESLKAADYGSQNFLDEPRISSYSGFYRMPLPFLAGNSGPAPLTSESFGYDEVNKRFKPPPAQAAPDLIVFASRGVSDTGNNLVDYSVTPPVLGTNGGLQVVSSRHAETITFNEDLGFRVNKSLPPLQGILSSISGGVDYKAFRQFSASTHFSQATLYVSPGSPGLSSPPLTSFTNSPTSVNYLPFSFNLDANRPDKWGLTSFYLYQSVNFNALSSSGAQQFATVAETSTARSDGNYYIVNSGFTREQKLYNQWALTLKASGQWADQTLIGNEQFGMGGIPGPRGYRDGEEYGDAGWRVSAEPHTPTYTVCMINDTVPLRVSGSVFMDYGERYDFSTKFTSPNGVALGIADRVPTVDMWGAGVGLNGMIGKIYEVHFALAVPLLTAGSVPAGDTQFYFSLSAQF
jgi:hemolysin activation/secretion protein/AraC-like DNA-binding protein